MTTAPTLPTLPIKPLLWALVLAAPLMPHGAQAEIKASRHYTGPGVYTISCSDDATGKALRCPIWETREAEVGGPLQSAFHTSNFAALDAMFDTVSSGKARFADGSRHMEVYQNTLRKLFSNWKRWDEDYARVKTWQTNRPDSVAAKLAEVIYWETYAWNARGTAFASDVRPESWALFKERLAKAHAVLDLIKPMARQLPAWYDLKTNLLLLTASNQDARAAFDEGVALFPDYYPLYLTMARGYEPKWGGSLAQFDKFANESITLAKGFEGRGMYARIYWTVDSTHAMPFRSEDDKAPEWEKLNAGFADLMKLYPEGDNILNRYASLACRSRNGKLYRTLRTRLDAYVDDLHFKMVTLDVCDRRHQWKMPAGAAK